MRIISGKFKGKKIFLPNDNNTRPLKDLTKESIFNIITHTNLFDIEIKKSFVLDLFSGTGSFGLECISRGCKSVTFIENYDSAIKILEKNIKLLKLKNDFNIIKENFFKKKIVEKIKFKFDIIFIDPPYKERKLNIIFKIIKNNNLLKHNGVIIIHRHKNSNDVFPEEFKLLIKKKYGISNIFFLVYS